MILATALGLGVMFEKVPLLHDGLKLVGSAYLLWLAWKVANASGPADGSRPLIPAHQGGHAATAQPQGLDDGALPPSAASPWRGRLTGHPLAGCSASSS